MTEMKNFKDYYKTVLEIFGEPQSKGGHSLEFETFDYELGDYKNKDVAVYTNSNQKEDDYPRVVILPLVSKVPIMKGELDDGTKFTQHESIVQTNIFSKSTDEIEAIDISTALLERLAQFMMTRTRFIKDKYDWEEVEAGIYVNRGYTIPFMKKEERYLIRYDKYERKDNLVDVKATNNSFVLLEDGLYVNGEIGLEMFEAYKGKVFNDLDTLYLRGIEDIEDLTQMIEARSDEEDQEDANSFMLQHKILFNLYREKPIEEKIGEVHIDAKRRKN